MEPEASQTKHKLALPRHGPVPDAGIVVPAAVFEEARKVKERARQGKAVPSLLDDDFEGIRKND